MEKILKARIKIHTGPIGAAFAKNYLEKKGYVVCEFQFPDDHNPLALCKHVRCSKKIDKTKCMRKKFEGEDSVFCYEYLTEWRSHFTGPPVCPCTKLYPKICDGCDCCPCLFIKIISMNDVLKKKAGRESVKRLPDFLAHKDGKHYFVEVKTNTGTLSKHQKEFLIEIRDAGVGSLLIRVILDIRYTIREEKF